MLKLSDKIWLSPKANFTNKLIVVDFLCNRKARIKILDSLGEWIESLMGTSAGTVLGPVLFIIFAHDMPKPIKPKFADDVSAVESGKD